MANSHALSFCCTPSAANYFILTVRNLLAHCVLWRFRVPCGYSIPFHFPIPKSSLGFRIDRHRAMLIVFTTLDKIKSLEIRFGFSPIRSEFADFRFYRKTKGIENISSGQPKIRFSNCTPLRFHFFSLSPFTFLSPKAGWASD